MNNVMISVNADGYTVAYGYNSKFYEDETKRNADIVRDMLVMKSKLGDVALVVSLAEWADDANGDAKATAFSSFDDIVNKYNSKEVQKVLGNGGEDDE